MSKPEVKVTIDKYGHVVYKATEEAVLLSQDEKEFIIDRFASLQAENQKLRELLDFALPIAMYAASTEEGDRMRELMREVEL